MGGSMSQVPPGAPQGPGQFPQGSNFPQQNPPPGQSRTSGAAVASLICGIVGCTIIGGLLGLILGLVGISATKNPAVKGRGMAITGLILSILFLGLWALGCSGMYHLYQRLMHGPESQFAEQYIKDLDAGDATAVMNESTSAITAPEVDEWIARMKTWGTLQKTAVGGIEIDSRNGQTTIPAAGKCQFSSGQSHSFAMKMHNEGGTLKAESLEWDGRPNPVSPAAPTGH